MTTVYAKITSKGQITIPVTARRELNLKPGERLAVNVEGDSLKLSAPPDIDKLRNAIREEAKAQGTWGTVPTANDGWNARADELIANRHGSHDGER